MLVGISHGLGKLLVQSVLVEKHKIGLMGLRLEEGRDFVLVINRVSPPVLKALRLVAVAKDAKSCIGTKPTGIGRDKITECYILKNNLNVIFINSTHIVNFQPQYTSIIDALHAVEVHGTLCESRHELFIA